MKFSVTFDIVTDESAELGDVAERGFICEDVGLREALSALWETRTAHVDGVNSIEPSASDVASARWVTILNGREFLTGAVESRSLHFPEDMSAASRVRLVRAIQNGIGV